MLDTSLPHEEEEEREKRMWSKADESEAELSSLRRIGG